MFFLEQASEQAQKSIKLQTTTIHASSSFIHSFIHSFISSLFEKATLNKHHITMTSSSLSKTPANSSAKASTTSKSATTKKKKPTKKKKASAKKTNATNAANLMSAARTQYQKLLKQREAKLHDSAWLSTIPSPSTTTISISNKIESPSFLDQDVEIVNKALKNNGLNMEDITTEGFACLLEEARKYAMEIITDASDYAMHSHGTDNITPADLKLAKEMQDEFDVDSMDALAKIAQETNSRMLPPIPDNCYNGIVLPDPEHTLMGRSYDIVGRKDEERPKETNALNVQKIDEKKISMPSYGARRGKQVQIALQSNAASNQGSLPNASNAMDMD